MIYNTQLTAEPTLDQPDAPLAIVRDDGRASTGATIPPDEARARQIAREAFRLAAFMSERTRMRPATVQQKALDAACFSVLKGASSLAVPTKLAGTGAHQRRLWAMLKAQVPAWHELTLDVREGEIAVLYGDEKIGEIQRKHGWVRPLIPFGARLYLSKVTGSERSGYTLGVNVVVGHVGHALDRLLDALGEAGLGGDGAAGDGATGDGATGDGAAGGLRLVTPARGTPSEADPDDVVLLHRLGDHPGAHASQLLTDRHRLIDRGRHHHGAVQTEPPRERMRHLGVHMIRKVQPHLHQTEAACFLHHATDLEPGDAQLLGLAHLLDELGRRGCRAECQTRRRLGDQQRPLRRPMPDQVLQALQPISISEGLPHLQETTSL